MPSNSQSSSTTGQDVSCIFAMDFVLESVWQLDPGDSCLLQHNWYYFVTQSLLVV